MSLSCPLQFMDRLKLLLMPLKHQPDFIYLRHVPLRRVHLFTFLQVVCLALLWILKSTVAAIIFPVMVGDVLPRAALHLPYPPTDKPADPASPWQTPSSGLCLVALMSACTGSLMSACMGSLLPWLPRHQSSGGKRAWKVNFFPESCC